MYRIMLADDEGIMLEALKNIITSNFGDECEIATAKTGRAVVELAESFRPDIAFMGGGGGRGAGGGGGRGGIFRCRASM